MITVVPGTGLRLSLGNDYQPLRPFAGGGELWDFQYQNVIRNNALGRILPRADWSAADGEVTFVLTDHGREVTSRSRPIRRFRSVSRRHVENIYALQSELRALADDPHTAPAHRRAIEQFRLPDPKLDPDSYRVYGPIWNRRLLILWGFARVERSGVLPGLTPEEVGKAFNGSQDSPFLGWKRTLLGLGAALLALLLLAYVLCKVVGLPICSAMWPQATQPPGTVPPAEPPADGQRPDAPSQSEPGQVASAPAPTVSPQSAPQSQDDPEKNNEAASPQRPADAAKEIGQGKTPVSEPIPAPSQNIPPALADKNSAQGPEAQNPAENSGGAEPSSSSRDDKGSQSATAPTTKPPLDDGSQPQPPSSPDLQEPGPHPLFEDAPQATKSPNEPRPEPATPNGNRPSPPSTEPSDAQAKLEPMPPAATDPATPSQNREGLGQSNAAPKSSVWLRPSIIAEKMTGGSAVQVRLRVENMGSGKADLRKTKWAVRGKNVERFGPNVSFDLPPADRPYTLEVYPDGETEPNLYQLSVGVTPKASLGNAPLRRRK